MVKEELNKEPIINTLDNIEVRNISNDLFQLRTHKQEIKDREGQEFAHLKESITNNGLTTAIVVTPAHKRGNYLLIDGRRRLEIFKSLGLETIPALIIKNKSREDYCLMAVLYNIHRLNITGAELIRTIIQLFEVHGYNENDIILNCGRLANIEAGKQYKSDKRKVEEKFEQLVKKLGYTARYLRELVDVYEKLEPEIFELCEEQDLDLPHRALLCQKRVEQMYPTNTPDQYTNDSNRRKKISMQRHAVFMIHKAKIDKARKDMEDYLDSLENSERENQEFEQQVEEQGLQTAIDNSVAEDDAGYHNSTPEIAKASVTKYFELVDATNKMIEAITGTKLEGGEVFHKSEHVKYSEAHRKELVEYMGERECNGMRNELIHLEEAIDSMIKLMEEKYPPDLSRKYPN